MAARVPRQSSLSRSRGHSSPDGLRPLRVLIVEAQEARAKRVIRELQHGGFAPELQRATTESAYLEHLTPTLDLIVARHTLPPLDARRALELLRARKLDIPFIIIGPTADEETVLADAKLGAADYLLEDRLARLGQAVEQALDRRRLRMQREWADTRLHESEERYHSLFEGVPVGLYRATLGGQILEVNPAFVQMLSYPDR